MIFNCLRILTRAFVYISYFDAARWRADKEITQKLLECRLYTFFLYGCSARGKESRVCPLVDPAHYNKMYSLHWQPKRLNSTIRTVWLITNSLMYISKTIYESITIYKRVLLIRMSSKIKATKMSHSKTVNAL